MCKVIRVRFVGETGGERIFEGVQVLASRDLGGSRRSSDIEGYKAEMIWLPYSPQAREALLFLYLHLMIIYRMRIDWESWRLRMSHYGDTECRANDMPCPALPDETASNDD